MDNLFLTPANEQSDFITTVYPQLLLNYKRRLLDLDVDYGLKFRFFNEFDGLDETSIKDTQRSSAKAVFFPSSNFNLTLGQKTERVARGARSITVPVNDFVNKTRLTEYSINPKYTFVKRRTFQATTQYSYVKSSYGDSSVSDIEVQRASLNLSKDMTSKLVIRTDLETARVSYENLANYDRYSFSGGAAYRFSEYWTIDGNLGVARISPIGGNTFSLGIGDLALKYDDGGITSKLSYASTIPPSLIDGAYKSEIAYGGFSVKRRGIWSMSVQSRRDFFFNSTQENRSLVGTLNYEVPLSRRITLTISGDWSAYEFLPGNITEDQKGAGLSLYRRFSWGDMGVAYNYNENISDDPTRDFRSNYYMVNIRMAL
jgi:hypothetical protein